MYHIWIFFWAIEVLKNRGNVYIVAKQEEIESWMLEKSKPVFVVFVFFNLKYLAIAMF